MAIAWKSMLSSVMGVISLAGLLAACAQPGAMTGAPTASVSSAPSRSLQIFTVQNTLDGWSAQGLRDAQGRVVVPPSGTGTFTPLPGGGFLRSQPGHDELFDANGRQIAGPYRDVELPAPDAPALIVYPNVGPDLGKAGLFDMQGRELLPPIYDVIDYLPGTGFFRITSENHRWGLADAHGKVLAQPDPDTLYDDAPGAVLVSNHDQHGLIGPDGHFVVPLVNAGIQPVHDGETAIDRFMVCDYGDAKPGCSVIDAQGKTLFGGMRVEAAEYARNLHRWMVVMYRDDPSVALDYNNMPRLLLDESGKTLGRFDCGLSSSLMRIGNLFIAGRSRDDGMDCLVGLVDRDGKWVVQPEYSGIDQMRDATHDDSAPVEYRVDSAYKDGEAKVGILDANGHSILATAYYNITDRYAQLGLYQAGQRLREWGIVDRDGHWRVPPVYYGSSAPNSDLPLPFMMFSKDGETDDGDRYYLYDLRSGHQVFTQPYRHLSVEYNALWKSLGLPWNEYAVIVAQRPDGKTGVIDFAGNTIVPFQYDDIDDIDALGEWGQIHATKNRRDVTIMALPAAKAEVVRDAISRAIRNGPAPIPNALLPYMGRFTPVDYLDEAALNDAVAKKRLARPVAPMMLVDDMAAIVDFSMLTSKRVSTYDFREYYCPRDTGFDVSMRDVAFTDESCADPHWPMLKFRRTTHGDWHCDGCGQRGLPVLWRRLDAQAAGQ